MSFWDRFFSSYSSFINRATNVSWILQFMDKIGSASSSTDGFMSATDKGNLDGVLSGSVVPPVAGYASSANVARHLEHYEQDGSLLYAPYESPSVQRIYSNSGRGVKVNYADYADSSGYATSSGYSSSTGSFPHSHTLSDITNGEIVDLGAITISSGTCILWANTFGHVTFVRIRWLAPPAGANNLLYIGGPFENLVIYGSAWDVGGTIGRWEPANATFVDENQLWLVTNLGSDGNIYGNYAAVNLIILKGWW